MIGRLALHQSVSSDPLKVPANLPTEDLMYWAKPSKVVVMRVRPVDGRCRMRGTVGETTYQLSKALHTSVALHIDLDDGTDQLE